MTTLPPVTPLLPVLGRMALGLGIAAGGLLLSLPGVQVRLTPGMEVVRTTLGVPLDGPLPLDLASSAQVNVRLDRASLGVQALGLNDARVLGAQVRHRARNVPQLSVSREGRRVQSRLNLSVPPLQRGGLVVSGPEPVQHAVQLGLTRRIPLALTVQSEGGALSLDLRALRVQTLSTRTGSGTQRVTLPAREAGSLALVSEQGAVTVQSAAPQSTASQSADPQSAAPASGARAGALRVNSVSGDLALNLRGWSVTTLGVGTSSGAVRLTLPAALERGTVTTLGGPVTVTVPPGTRGNLDIRTQRGRVTLRVSPQTRLRVRFTDRDTVTLPADLSPDVAPDLDVFVDSYSGDFRLDNLDGVRLTPDQPGGASSTLSAPVIVRPGTP